MRPLLVFCALVVPALAWPSTRFAFVVGHNSGHLDEAPLRWAEADAQRFQRALLDVGNVAPERSALLLSPDLERFRTAWTETKGKLAEARLRGEHTTLFFFFSGHGDSGTIHLGRQAVPLAEFRREMAAASSVVVAIVDACRNDRQPRVKSKGALRAPGFDWPSDWAEQQSGLVVIASAGRGEVAQESDDLQSSLFTHHLLTGMAGSADFDGDGVVTLEELYRYGFTRTLEESHGEGAGAQHSELDMRLAGQGALVITYPRRALARLAIEPEVKGSILIIDDASGRVVSEVEQRGERPIEIAVPPGRYRVQVREQDEVRAGLVAVGPGMTALARRDLELRRTRAILHKGAGYDPHPWLLSASLVGSTPTLAGFSWAPGVRWGLSRRAFERWRFGAELQLAMSWARSPLWYLHDVDFSLAAGADRVWSWGAFSLTAGPRIGALVIRQGAERVDAERLQQVLPVATQYSGATWGPRAGLAAGLEFQPHPRLGLRLATDLGSWLVHADRSLQLGYGIGFAVAGMMRF
ncbi:MAG: caspase family protein [Deltaproteobacteria bacterium]|nr:caspase family protein [Deltaproteobacteria bacterium]